MSNKITIDMLVFIISNFCGFSDPNISRDQKYICAEWNTNCMVVQNGYSTNEIVNKCKEEYSDIEMRNKRAKNWR